MSELPRCDRDVGVGCEAGTSALPGLAALPTDWRVICPAPGMQKGLAYLGQRPLQQMGHQIALELMGIELA